MQRTSALRRWSRKTFNNWFTVGTAVMLLLIIAAVVFAPYLTAYEPNAGRLSRRFITPNADHWLGTDHLGRDMFSRLLHGGRVSLIVGAGATAFSLLIGGVIGTAAGYFRGNIELVTMRVVDLLMAFPYLLLAITVVTILGFGIQNVILAIGIAGIPGYARLARSLVISIQETDFVTAARALGASHTRIIVRHVLVNCVSPLATYATLSLGRAILAEASLSFIGLGIQPPDTSWGVLVNEGKAYLRSFPHLALLPGFAVLMTVFSFNMVTDAVRDALDPRLQ